MKDMHLVMLAEAGTTPGATGGADMSVVMNSITWVVDVVGKVWDVVTGNPYLLFGLGAAALTIGVGVFATIRGSVH